MSKKQLTEAQTRAALVACRKFREKRDSISNARTLDTVAYSMATNVMLVPYDSWILKIRVGTGLFQVTGGDPAQAIDKAMQQLAAALPGGAVEPRKRGPHPGPRPIKDGSAVWTDAELVCMRTGIEALLSDIYVKEAEQQIGDIRVRISTLPGDSWTAVAKVVGHRAATLVAHGPTRAEALRRLALRN